MVISAMCHTPLALEVAPGPRLSVLFKTGPSRYRIHHRGGDLEMGDGDALFFDAGAPYRLETGYGNAVLISLEANDLSLTAAGMASQPQPHERWNGVLSRPQVVSGQHNPQMAALLASLSRVLNLLKADDNGTTAHLRLLQVDTMIRRLIVLALLPEIGDPGGGPWHHQPQLHQQVALDDLLGWMKANLAAPINLADLEQQACYSRRSLQYLFSRQFGMGPMQWLRRLRLESARERLQCPSPDDTVQGIALACGYTNPSAFSRDFSSLYGARASALLRAARLRQR